MEILQKDVETLKDRMTIVEGELKEVKKELTEKAISDGKVEQILITMQSTIQLVQADTKEIRGEMMKLVLKAMDQNRDDDMEEKKFYRKLVISAVTILATIVLATFGITKLIPLL